MSRTFTKRVNLELSEHKATKDDVDVMVDCIFSVDKEIEKDGERYTTMHMFADVLGAKYYEVKLYGRDVGLMCEDCFREITEGKKRKKQPQKNS